jgi:hypothetical protein
MADMNKGKSEESKDREPRKERSGGKDQSSRRTTSRSEKSTESKREQAA